MADRARTSFAVGLFVIAALGVGAFALWNLGASRGLLAKRYTLVTYFADIQGLVQGGTVRLAGKDIGSIERVEFAGPGDRPPGGARGAGDQPGGAVPRAQRLDREHRNDRAARRQVRVDLDRHEPGQGAGQRQRDPLREPSRPEHGRRARHRGDRQHRDARQQREQGGEGLRSGHGRAQARGHGGGPAPDRRAGAQREGHAAQLDLRALPGKRAWPTPSRPFRARAT